MVDILVTKIHIQTSINVTISFVIILLLINEFKMQTIPSWLKIILLRALFYQALRW